MAQHKVPQDVEADDKLLGPFSFRQFIYLLITAGSAALAVALFQIFPILAILPVPFVIFFAILALPLRRDQPMETYLAAIVSFYFKPHRRVWMPGQRESTIVITAPKKVEQPRTRNLSEEEASRRLSFLADIIDSEGLSIRNSTVDLEDTPASISNVQEDVVAEANTATDMLGANSSANIDQIIKRRQADRRSQIMSAMYAAADNADAITAITNPSPTPPSTSAPALPSTPNPTPVTPPTTSPAVATPQPAPAPSHHDLQLNEMRKVIQKTEAARNFGAPDLDHHINFTPAESTGPDYGAAMDALLHPENTPTAQPSQPITQPAPTSQPVTQATSTPQSSATPAPFTLTSQPSPAPVIPAPLPQSSTTPTPPPQPTTSSPQPTTSPPPTSQTAPPVRKVPSARFVNLASNQDYTIATIQKEADRIKKADEAEEVFISLH